ncbi:MAG: type II secretion system F family protein [Isosphaeraceae bacterium]|nr:type II secretion system F family protein [Isosphaeraceae bacterium]
MTPELKNPSEPKHTPNERPPARRQRFLLQHMMLVVLFAGVGIWLLILSFQYLGWLALVLLVFLGAALAAGSVVVGVKGFWTQQDAVLRALAIAADRGMPLAPALQAIADHCGFFLRARVLALADTLQAGAPFPDALDMTPGVLPPDAEVIARVGYDTGVLPGALREAADARVALPSTWGWIVARLCYLMGVLLVLQSVIGFISYFILPKFEAIFKDFGAPLPQFTILVIQATHAAIRYGWASALLVGLEVAILFLLPLTLVGWLNVGIPVLDRLFIRRHSALILRALAGVVESGQPLNRAFGTLARRYPRTWVRDQLRMVALDIDRGQDWCEALRNNGLIGGPEVAALDAARRVGNLPWTLRQTAETLERRLAYRMQAWLQLIFPVLVLMVGGVVFAVAVAYFAPLVSLIERLAG